ncbi:MAG: DUF167 domain-containing protein [Acidobacteria bacterium]|nr:MAG: DUF167 domain-containing protein [Acidobacteriota bacterium]
MEKRGQIDLRVTPRASKNAIEGFRNGALIVRVTAPPVDSAANDAVIELLARALRVAKRDISILRGSAARNKIVSVTGLSSAELQSRFEK